MKGRGQISQLISAWLNVLARSNSGLADQRPDRGGRRPLWRVLGAVVAPVLRGRLRRALPRLDSAPSSWSVQGGRIESWRCPTGSYQLLIPTIAIPVISRPRSTAKMITVGTTAATDIANNSP